MSIFFRKTAVALVYFAALCDLSFAHAETFPVRPITLLVPLAAGSTADIISRTIGTQLSKEMKQPVIVMNKPGAGGTIAMQELAHDAPDGYTIAFASEGQLVFNLVLYKKPGYSQNDIVPLAIQGAVANVLVVPASSQFRSVQELIAYAKSHPGEVNFASGGNGTSHHLSSALLAQLAGLKLVHVPYAGAPQGTLAVMSGEVQMAFFNITTELSQIRSGKLRALAVTSTTRSPLLPDVPTMQEAGVKGFEVSSWQGFVAPAGTPPDVVTTLYDALTRAINEPSVKRAMVLQGVAPAPNMTPQHFREFMSNDLKKWTPVIKTSGASID